MFRGRIIITLVLAAALAVPGASALWRAHGTYEPDTKQDADDGYMFVDPDTDPVGKKVYFNGVVSYFQSSVNPNNGVTGSRVWAAPAVTYSAYLGAWKDCNDDGYIGMADNAITEYRAEALLDADICPPGSAWNDNGWVYEFLWIGPGDRVNASFENPRYLNDTAANVWGDFGLPGSEPGRTCPINPPPAGTTSSTGGALNYVDCIFRREIAKMVNVIATSFNVDEIRFDDPEHPEQSDSLLNQDTPISLFGNPYAGENNDEYQTGLIERDSNRDPKDNEYDPSKSDKAFRVFTCSDPEWEQARDPTSTSGKGAASTITIADPTGTALTGSIEGFQVFYDHDNDESTAGVFTYNLTDEDGVYFSVPRPDPAVENPEGSYADGVNHTTWAANNVLSGGNQGSEPSEGPQSRTPKNCEKGRGTVGSAYPDVEEANEGVDAEDGRRETDLYFSFNHNFLGRNSGIGRSLEETSPGYPQDLGVGAYRHALGLGPSWTGLPNYLTTPQVVNRDATISGRTFVTYYGYTSLNDVTTRATTDAKYGAEWCGTATTGIENGADCDKENWWNPDLGATEMPRQSGREIGAKIHDPYNQRDIDCYDGTLVRGVPVQASLIVVHPDGPCLDAPGSIVDHVV